MSNLQTKAKAEADRFSADTDTEGLIILKDNSESIAKRVLFKLQDEFDFEDSYPLASEAFDFIADCDDDLDEDGIIEASYEYEYPSVYNATLTAWLAGNVYRIEDVDDCIKEWDCGVIQAIQGAQQRRFERAVQIALDELK